MLTIATAIATVGAFALAVYQHLQRSREKATETSKIEAQLERIRLSHRTALSCAHAANLIVQRSKEDSATVAELGNMARLARGQLFLAADELAREERQLATWEYGHFFKSTPAHLPHGRTGADPVP